MPTRKLPRIAHSKPTVGLEELQAVAKVLDSGHHARGPACVEFEQALAKTVGRKHAHAASSGTAALTLALLAMNTGPASEVLIPSLTCAAVLNAVRFCGARPVLYDCSYELPDTAMLKRAATRLTAAAIVVAPPQGFAGLGGFDCGVPVILDRCQQLATVTKGQKSGNAACEIFSFYATKCISTGSGGAVASDNAKLIARIVDLNTHDKRADANSPRFNFQFDDVRAAMGLAQLAKLKAFVAARAKNARAYAKSLDTKAPEGGMCYRYLHDCGSGAKCDALADRLAAQRIEAKRPVFKPLHRYLGLRDKDFPCASNAWARILSLPVYPSLTDEELGRVVNNVLR